MPAGRPSPWRLARRYGADRYHAHFVFFKSLLDPVYAAAAQRLMGTALPLLDVGCGPGLLAAYLRAAGFGERVTGLDYDARKIAVACRALADERTRFFVGDARHDQPDHCGHVAILDILQYMSAEDQAAVLTQAAARVAPGGWFILRTGLREANWRFRLTAAMDRLAKHAAWMKAEPVSYPAREWLRGQLEGCGLVGEVLPLSGRLPFNNFLFSYRRPADP